MQETILLLNASNYSGNLVYPYAFVQLSEIALRYGIKVLREDLFGIEVSDWIKFLEERFTKIDFKAIFITIRNIDTHGIHEYPPEIIHQTERQEAYYPLALTEKLVQTIREVSKLPIVIGGFGYSILPEKILRFVNADFGVFGGPEGLFENLDVLNDRKEIENVPNLYYNDNGVIRFGPRKFYGPTKNQQYTNTIINEIKEFNLKHHEKENVSPVTSVAVEISRGCPYRCSFCCEPLVVGNLMQYRNVDTILNDLQFLQKNGFYDIFFVCSELNPLGNDFAIKLSKRIYNLNKDFSEKEKIKWSATYLMNFTLVEFNALKKSGFVGGWYDVVSLEDENLRNNNAPYKSQNILEIISNLDGGLKGAFILEDEVLNLPERIYYNKPKTHTGSFFLGNPTASILTIRETLENAHKYRLDTIYDKTGINFATRIFDYINLTENELRATYSINFNGAQVEYDDLYPSFSYPPDLLDHFGEPAKIRDFFTYVQTTFLSSEHLFEINWHEFILNNLSSIKFVELWKNIDKEMIQTNSATNIPEVQSFLEDFNPKNIKKLYFKKYVDDELRHISFSINMALQLIFIKNTNLIQPILEYFKLSRDVNTSFKISSYEIMKKFYTTFSSLKEIIEFKNNQKEGSIEKLYVEYLWTYKNVRLNKKLKPFFMG